MFFSIRENLRHPYVSSDEFSRRLFSFSGNHPLFCGGAFGPGSPPADETALLGVEIRSDQVDFALVLKKLLEILLALNLGQGSRVAVQFELEQVDGTFGLHHGVNASAAGEGLRLDIFAQQPKQSKEDGLKSGLVLLVCRVGDAGEE